MKTEKWFSFFQKLSGWEKILLAILVLIFITPAACLILHSMGISIVHHQINVLYMFAIFLISNIFIFTGRKNDVLAIIPFTFFLFFFVSYLGSFRNYFYPPNDFVSFFGSFLSITIAPFVSVFIINYSRKKSNINLFYKLLALFGLIIAFVNIIFFVLLYSGGYALIYSYTEFIGLGDYLKDLGSFFVRPAGYFYDYHSQYYLPLITLFLIYTKKVQVKKEWRSFLMVILALSILLSGVKSAYITLVACIIYLMIRNVSFVNLIRYLLTLFLFFFIADYFLDSFFYELGYKIITHDINIILEHSSEVPVLLYEKYTSVFFLGGQVDFQNHIYSEVYYITMIYCLGIFGVFIFFIFPILFLWFKSNDRFIKLLTIIFGLSLFHYYVFKIGINLFGTALFYYYFLNKLFFKIKSE
jgi:hypothetical protein